MMLMWLPITACLLVNHLAIGGLVLNRSTSVEEEPVSNQWKADVLDTLGTLKEVLRTFEKKWEEIPSDTGNGTVHFKEDNSSKPLEATPHASWEPTTVRNESTTNKREAIKEDPTRRRQGDKTFGCPHAWPHHDIYPVVEPMCSADHDCEANKLCCSLFGNNYCLPALDSTPRSGDCRFTKFNHLASLHCLIDDPGCKYDSECSEPTWKCCSGPCQYKECLPSTISPSAADLQKQQHRTTTESQNEEQTTTAQLENQQAEELPAVVTTTTDAPEPKNMQPSTVETPKQNPTPQSREKVNQDDVQEEPAVAPRQDRARGQENKPSANNQKKEHSHQRTNRRRTHEQRTRQHTTPRQEEQFDGGRPEQQPPRSNRKHQQRSDNLGFNSMANLPEPWQDRSTPSSLFLPKADLEPLPFLSENVAQGQTGVSSSFPSDEMKFDETFSPPASSDSTEKNNDFQSDFLPFIDFRFGEFEGGAFDDDFL